MICFPEKMDPTHLSLLFLLHRTSLDRRHLLQLRRQLLTSRLDYFHYLCRPLLRLLYRLIPFLPRLRQLPL